MRKAEWANTDSRVEIVVDGKEVIVTVVNERDTYLTDEASVTMSTDQFMVLMAQSRTAIMNEEGRWP